MNGDKLYRGGISTFRVGGGTFIAARVGDILVMDVTDFSICSPFVNCH